MFTFTPAEMAYVTCAPTSGPKILYSDHETSTNQNIIENYGLKLFFKRMSADSIIRDWTILSTAWAWEHECPEGSGVEIPVKCVEVAPDDVFNDRHVVETIWHLLDQADIVVGHNWANFDAKKFNTRALFYGMPPPSPYKIVDTLKIARSNFAVTSNKLAYLCEYLKVPHQKGESPDWSKVLLGDKNEIQKMVDYNIGDIPSLRDVYHRIRGWDKGHVNLNLYNKDTGGVGGCYVCGSEDLALNKVYTRVNGDVVNSYRCKCCGAQNADNYKHKKIQPQFKAAKA